MVSRVTQLLTSPGESTGALWFLAQGFLHRLPFQRTADLTGQVVRFVLFQPLKS